MAVRRRLLVPAVVTAIVVVAVVVVAAMLVQGRDRASSAAPEPPVPSRLDELDPAVAEGIRKAVVEIRRDPGDVRKRLRLGMLYAANDCIDSAAATLQQAIALGCEDARAWYHLALVQAELGDLHAALASARAAASRRDDMAPVHWRQGF
jgi:tetratricopeptide (TPR) repeat protein